MAKTRSNKRPTTTTNTTAVDNKASLDNTTTTNPTPPTKALSTLANTRTRSKKCKGLSDEKSQNVKINKKTSKNNLSTIGNTHNTRRRSLNNKNTKNAAEEMDTSNMDSSPETGTDSNEIHSSESMSDNEQEVIKVIEIVDESQSYNLHEDDEDEEGKEYELVYVEDGEEVEGEIEYLNEEYLLDDDFIIQEQQNDDSSQNSIVIEEGIEECTMDSLSHDEVAEPEVVPTENIKQETILNETAKLPPIVPMATRSRRSHVVVTDISPEKPKPSKRKSRGSDKSTDGDVDQPSKISDDMHEIKKEPGTHNMELMPTISEPTKNEEITKPKIFIPNIEPPATRARSRKSISNSDSIVSIEPTKNEIHKNSLEQNKSLKSHVIVKMEKETCVNDSKSEEDSLETSNILQSTTETLRENQIQDTSFSEPKPENVETITKMRTTRRAKVLSTSSSPESNKTVLIGNKVITKFSKVQTSLQAPELDESTKAINQQSGQKNTDEVSLKLQKIEQENLQKIEQENLQKIEQANLQKIEQANLQKIEQENLQKIEKENLQKIERENLQKIERENLQKIERENLQKIEQENLQKIENIILNPTENEKSKDLSPKSPMVDAQPSPIRKTRLSKAKILKSDLESPLEKLNTNENTFEESEPVKDNNLKIEMISIDKKKEENEPPPEINLKSKLSPKSENDNVALIHLELKQAAELPKTNKKKSNNGSDMKAEVTSTMIITEDNKNKDHIPKHSPNTKIIEVNIESNAAETVTNEKDSPSGLRKLRRRSKKDSSPPVLSQIELNDPNSSQQITCIKSVTKIEEKTENITKADELEENGLTILNANIEVANSSEKMGENEEYKSSQEEDKSCSKSNFSRSQLAFTSIISTRRQKKEQVKSESLKPLEKISDNCMAIVEKLLQESSLNKSNTEITSPVIEINLSKTTVSPKTKSSKVAELKDDAEHKLMEVETQIEQDKVAESEKMEVDEINQPTESEKPIEIKFKESLGLSLEEKLKNIKLDEIKDQPEFEQSATRSTANELEPNSTKIEEFETKINRNFYAEAFAGLSHETRTHIFEALLRSKADNKSPPTNEIVKEEAVEFDDKKNIFIKKKSNKKIKKSSKKERKLDKNETSTTDESKADDDESLRRSSRIKTISQTRQRSHGHGLVRARDPFLDDDIDEESFNLIKYKALELDGVEAKDCTPTEETEVEVRREREMILRLKQFMTIKENIYHCDKNISKEAKKMTCDCFLTKEEIERGELGCGEDCLNRLLMIECGPKCVVAERCTNRKFQKTQYANCKVFQTEKKGFGIMAGAIIPPGEFVMEYVGEVLNSEQFEKRADDYSTDKNKHYYFMALRSDAVIDATAKGNISRFINHSCDPNAETQKWTVNGELRIGFFSTRVILKGEEITFDYQFQRYGKEAQKCFCEAPNCRGWIGEEPDSADDDDDDEEEEEEEDEEQQQPPQIEKVEELPPLIPILPAPIITEIKEIINEEIPPTPVVESTIIAPTEVTEVPIPPVVAEVIEMPPLVAIEKIKKPTKKERKALVKTRKTRSELLEDADLEEEINILNRTGLKNQAHTLKLSRLMVRAKLMNARIRLIQLLQCGELPCRRLFLDYHGLRLLHGWMSDSTAVSDSLDNVKFQLKLLETLKSLPIPNKTMLKDSKVINMVQKWSLNDKKTAHYSPNDDTPSDSGSGTPIQQNDSPNHNGSQSSTIPKPQSSVSSTVDDEYSYVSNNIIKISLKLIESWESLPEVFRIPKKERIEQMKEHEREADLRYKALGLSEDQKEKFDRFPEKNREWDPQKNRDKKLPYNNNGNNNGNNNSNNNNTSNKPTNSTNTPQLDKYQRRQIFEMKFAKEQEEKKKQEYWRLHEMTCTCFRLDPRKTAQEDVPAIVNPATGQWYTKEMKSVATPPSHAHIKPPEQVLSTNPDDYTLPIIDLPPHWKFAIDTKGRIYYYHVKIRIPQWEPPIFLPPLAVAEEIKPPIEPKDKTVDADKESSSTDTTDSSEDELKERINNLKQRFKERGQPLPEINITDSELVESLDVNAKNKDNFSDTFPRIDPVKSSYKINKRKRRREGLVQERIISPRTEEDKMYGQQQSRMYRETKEKLRRRKEEMRKRRLLETGSLSMRNNKIIKLTDGLPVSISPYDSDESDDETEQSYRKSNESINQNDPDNAVDFVESLISHNMSDNDARLLDGLKEIGKEKVNKKNVYEEWKKQQAKLKSEARKRELNQSKLIQSTSASSSTSSSSSSHGKRRKVVIDHIDLSSDEIRRIKEKFRTDIAGVIVQHLGPYRKESCKIGRILHDEDFKHLARKLTHFVMLKELKHCDNTVNILEVTDSVKTKSREFIKKYMTKYGAIYRRGENEPDYKD